MENFENSLFNPRRLEFPENIILIPHFWNGKYFRELEKSALKTRSLMRSKILYFPDYAVIEGFLGYPEIITLVEYIKDFRQKEIFFIGTAGSLVDDYQKPLPLLVEEIGGSSILEHFSKEKTFSMKTFPGIDCPFKRSRGVSVDIIQRETPQWLRTQLEREMEFVEMEIFPLRAFLGKPFYAIVVITDILKENLHRFFGEPKLLEQEFVNTYLYTVDYIKGKGEQREI